MVTNGVLRLLRSAGGGAEAADVRARASSLVFVLLDQAPGGVVVAGVGPALRARLGVRLVQEFLEGRLARALEGASFFETAMPTLLHGPLPVDVVVQRAAVYRPLPAVDRGGLAGRRRSTRAAMPARALVEVRRRLPDLPPVASPTPNGDGVGDLEGSAATSTTWRGWASTPSGCRRSSAPPWPTSATTSATTATSTRCSAPSTTSTACWPRPTRRGIRSSSTGCRTTPPTSTRGSSRPGRAATDPKRDWYVWRDPGPDGGPPNNWRQAFRDEPAWTLDEATGQYYLHLFLPEQPDLNWANPEVEAAMHDTLRFWLDRGVDGFRMDVIHAIGKDPALPDDPPEVAAHPPLGAQRHAARPTSCCAASARCSTATTATACRSARCSCSTRPRSPRTTATATSCTSRSTSRRCSRRGGADRGARQLDDVADAASSPAGWPTWVLSNHDNPRHRTRYGSEARARAAAVLLLGAAGHAVPLRRRGARARGRRGPGRPGGRPRRARRLPGPDPVGRAGRARLGRRRPVAARGRPTPTARNVEALRDDPASILHLYRRAAGGPARRRPRSSSATRRCSTRPTACWPGSGAARRRPAAWWR